MNNAGISKFDLKRRNRAQVLKIIRESGPISRVDIAASMGITRAAVTIITNEMLDRNILEEVGEAPIDPNDTPQKGRRKILLDMNNIYRFAVGIYIDEKELSIGLTTLGLEALDKSTVVHDGDMSPEKLVSLIRETIKTMLQNSCLSKKNILGVGVGVMPSAFAMMGIAPGTECNPVFPALQKGLEENLELPVYIYSAVTEFAMTGIFFDKAHSKPENEVFLFWDHGNYRAIPVRDGLSVLPDDTNDDFVEQLCVQSDGKIVGGYPIGSVHAELTAKALCSRIRSVFSEDKTPTLYAALEGELSKITLPILMHAAVSDEALQEITENTLQKFCVMLHNLYCLYFAKHINLYGFHFTAEQLDHVRMIASNLGGERFAKSILPCPIGDRYRFLCGCSYAIQMGFYQTGGLCE